MTFCLKIFASLILLPIISTAACSGIANQDYSGQPYFEINGQVTNDQALSTNGNLRVALVWTKRLPDNPGNMTINNSFRVAQETAINAEFPSSFHLDIDRLPPKEVMMDMSMIGDSDEINPWDPNRQAAVGSIIVYQDNNNNKQLDLLDPEATELVDIVVGVPVELVLYYIEGSPFALQEYYGNSLQYNSGFNMIQYPDKQLFAICEPANPCDCAFECTGTGEEPDATCLEKILQCQQCQEQIASCKDNVWLQHPTQTLPLDAEIVIPLTSDPTFSKYLCQSTELHIEVPTPIFYDQSNLGAWPQDAKVECSDDGKRFEVSFHEKIVTICQNVTKSYWGTGWLMEWQPGDPVPEGWPCELK